MTKYAERTTVNPAATLAEIQTLVEDRYKCKDFAFRKSPEQVMVIFDMQDRRVRFTLPLPNPDDRQFKFTDTGRVRTGNSGVEAYQQAVRSKYRALLLTIKAKLESVESGIETFQEAFMAQIVLPGGQTMSEWAVPQIEKAYAGGEMPPLLGSGMR